MTLENPTSRLTITGATPDDVETIMEVLRSNETEHPKGPKFSIDLTHDEDDARIGFLFEKQSGLSKRCKFTVKLVIDPTLKKLGDKMRKAADRFEALDQANPRDRMKVYAAFKHHRDCQRQYMKALEDYRK